MTMTQQERDVLTQNWDQAKSQIQAQFPGLSQEDVDQGQSSPDTFANTVAAKTGQDAKDVEQALRQIAQQYSGGQGQGQTQS